MKVREEEEEEEEQGQISEVETAAPEAECCHSDLNFT